MSREYSLEDRVVATEVVAYMRENKKSLEQAYEDKGVPKDMQLTGEEIEEIMIEEAIGKGK